MVYEGRVFVCFGSPMNPKSLEQWPAFSTCTVNVCWMDAQKTVPAVGKASVKDVCRSSICVSVCPPIRPNHSVSVFWVPGHCFTLFLACWQKWC